jgi:hypothetical protein
MFYKNLHDNILTKIKLENRIKSKDIYYENHHIIPKHMGGNNEPDNLILLTFREHIIIHFLLWKIHNRIGDKLMCLMRSNQKEESQELRVKMAVEKNRTSGLGFKNWSGDKHPMLDKKKVAQVLKTKFERYGKSLRNMTNEVRKRYCDAAKKRANTDAVKQKRIDTVKYNNSQLTREELLKKYGKYGEKNANYGWIKCYYILIDPNGNEQIFNSQKEIIEKLNVTQCFLMRNRNVGIINKPVHKTNKEGVLTGKWNGWELKYFKNPHPLTGKIEKTHKSHKKK